MALINAIHLNMASSYHLHLMWNTTQKYQMCSEWRTETSHDLKDEAAIRLTINYKSGLLLGAASLTTLLAGLFGFSRDTFRGEELENEDRSGLDNGLTMSLCTVIVMSSRLLRSETAFSCVAPSTFSPFIWQWHKHSFKLLLFITIPEYCCGCSLKPVNRTFICSANEM